MKSILNKKLINIFLEKVLFFLVITFPIIIPLGSLAINITTALLSVITFFYLFRNFQTLNHIKKIIIYIIIFFLFILLNTLIQFINFKILFKTFANFRYLFLTLAVFLVLERLSYNQKTFYYSLNLIVVSLICLDIFYQFIFYQNILGFSPGMCTSDLPIKCLRFSGVFGDELIAGSYLSQIGLLIFILFMNSNIISHYFFIKSFLLLFFLVITILLTGERSALLIFTFFTFFFFFFKKKLINFLILSIFFIFFIFFLSQKVESINDRFVVSFKSLGWGVISDKEMGLKKITQNPWSLHYYAAIELFLEKPLIGHGPKSFRIKCENTKIDKDTRDRIHYYRDYRACSTHPHNYLLEFISENGIIGGLFFIGLFFFIFFSIYKKYKIPILISIGSLILAIILPFRPSGSFFSTFNASMFFYIFGFFLHYLNKNK
jgi:O-antigen ligase